MKNWTVKVKQIKKGGEFVKFNGHIKYLLNENNENHLETSISVLSGSPDNITNAHLARSHYREANNMRGGYMRNASSSFVLTLPNNIKQPSKEQWGLMLRNIHKTIARNLNVDLDVITNHSFAVLHEETAHNKHSHIHFLISNIIGVDFVKMITQREMLKAIKESWNKSVKNVLGVDYKDYKPKKSGIKDVPIWQARINKAVDAELEMIDKIEALKVERQQIEQKSNEKLIKDIQEMNKEHSKLMASLNSQRVRFMHQRSIEVAKINSANDKIKKERAVLRKIRTSVNTFERLLDKWTTTNNATEVKRLEKRIDKLIERNIQPLSELNGFGTEHYNKLIEKLSDALCSVEEDKSEQLRIKNRPMFNPKL